MSIIKSIDSNKKNLADMIIAYRNSRTIQKLTEFSISPLAMLLQVIVACLVVSFDFEINGVAIFGFIAIGMLILCSDLLSILLPLLLTTVFATACYDSASKFLSFIIPEAILIVLSLVFHLVVYEKKLTIGKGFWGLVAVSIAIVFGGIGSISLSEYFSPGALYHTVFLGPGLIILYLVINGYYKESKSYNIYEKFAVIMYIMGMFACFNILKYYFDNLETIIATPSLPEFQASNNLSTFIMFAIPFPCYFAIKKNRLHFLSTITMYLFLLLSGSGGGFLMGTVTMLCCFIYMIVFDKKARFVWIGITSLCIVGGLFALAFLFKAYKFASFDDMFYSNNMRIALLRRSLYDFSSHPIFGVGIGYTGNSDIYNPKSGAMNWYHMMIPQIIGSMGVVGILGYLGQFIIRARLIIKNFDLYNATLALSYLGLFFMSQVNPGEFCPIPYGLLAVLIFIFIERRKLPEKKNKL